MPATAVPPSSPLSQEVKDDPSRDTPYTVLTALHVTVVRASVRLVEPAYPSPTASGGASGLLEVCCASMDSLGVQVGGGRVSWLCVPVSCRTKWQLDLWQLCMPPLAPTRACISKPYLPYAHMKCVNMCVDDRS